MAAEQRRPQNKPAGKPNIAPQNGQVDERLHNTQVERAALGAILFDDRLVQMLPEWVPGNLLVQAAETIDTSTPEAEPLFFAMANRLIFGAIVRILEREEPVTLPTLHDELQRHALLESVGGAPYLASLTDDVITVDERSVGQYFNIILDKWRRRFLLRNAEAIARSAIDGPVSGALRRLESEVIEPLDRAADNRMQWWTLDDVMEAQDFVNLVGDAVIEERHPCVIIGPPGVGKSRLVSQLALDIAMGVEHWLGVFPIHRHGLKIAMLQTENMASRLKREMKRALRGCTQAERDAVAECIRWQALNTVDDTVPSLEDPDCVTRLARGIDRLNPDIVIVDPLNAFFIGEDENSAMCMRQTLRTLQRIATAGNPDRTLIVLHHAKSGRSAAAGADGWDRGAYGRGSKALAGWCRSQINVSPGSGENNDTLVISCGKISNGPVWPTFAVNLDVEHMLYRVDPDFDLEAWREEVSRTKPKGGQGRGRTVGADAIRMIMRDANAVAGSMGWLRKADLRQRIEDALGVSRASAYKAIEWGCRHGVLIEAAGSYQLRDS